MDKSSELAARQVGDGLPVLIIHGWTMAAFVEEHDLEPVFTRKNGYRRIYIDLPGMGKSPADGVKDLDDMLVRVSSFVDKHILPSKFLLIGTSLGAYLARALAYKYADSVDGLLLRVPVTSPEDAKRDVDAFTPVIADHTLMASLSDAEREGLGDIPVQTAEYIDKLKRRYEAIVVPAVAAADSANLDPIRNDPERYKLTAKLHDPENRFLKPALILTGRKDTVVGYRDASQLAEAYPRATFVALDRADHGLPVDQTHLFEMLIEDWLWRVEETQRASL